MKNTYVRETLKFQIINKKLKIFFEYLQSLVPKMSIKKIQVRHFPPGINLQVKEKAGKTVFKQLNVYGIKSINETQLDNFVENSIVPQEQQLLSNCKQQLSQAIRKIYLKNTEKHSRKYQSDFKIKAHKQPIAACGFSKYGDFFATAGYDRTCKLWQTQTGSLITSLTGHLNAIFSIDISEFNYKRLIATGSFDKSIKIWGMNGKRFHNLIGHEAEVTKVQFNPNGLYILSSSMDGLIKVWDLEKGRKVMDLKGHESEVTSFSHNYQGDQIISSGFTNTPIIFDLKSGQIIHKLLGEHEGQTTCCKFQFTGQLCATAGNDKKCVIWDVGSGTPMEVLENHEEQILDIDFNPAGDKLVTGSADSQICIYNVNLGTLQHKLKGHQRQVTRVKFNSQGDFILSAGFDGIGRIWNSETGQNIDLLQGHQDQIFSCDISYYGNKILTCSKDSTCVVWNQKLQK